MSTQLIGRKIFHDLCFEVATEDAVADGLPDIIDIPESDLINLLPVKRKRTGGPVRRQQSRGLPEHRRVVVARAKTVTQ